MQVTILPTQRPTTTNLSYLCDKVADERDVGVLLFAALADIGDHRNSRASAQQMDHAIQQHFLQLQLGNQTFVNY